MGNPMASSIAPLSAIESPGSIEFAPDRAAEQARDFHFAVTWVTLFAHLDPIEASGPRPRVENPSSTLALVPVVAAPLMDQRMTQDPNAAWEMVVPKMIRTGGGSFAPAEPGERRLL
jgi:hypothetical protein